MNDALQIAALYSLTLLKTNVKKKKYAPWEYRREFLTKAKKAYS